MGQEDDQETTGLLASCDLLWWVLIRPILMQWSCMGVEITWSRILDESIATNSLTWWLFCNGLGCNLAWWKVQTCGVWRSHKFCQIHRNTQGGSSINWTYLAHPRFGYSKANTKGCQQRSSPSIYPRVGENSDDQGSWTCELDANESQAPCTISRETNKVLKCYFRKINFL